MLIVGLQDKTDGINFFNSDLSPYTEMATSPNGVSPATTPKPTTNIAYRPVYKHWFFNRTADSKVTWTPFSMVDSMSLEEAFIGKS